MDNSKSMPSPITDTPDLSHVRTLARTISVVENEIPPYQAILKKLRFHQKTPVIGITGPPGAGKSTLLNALLQQIDLEEKRVAIIAVDPTSPFNYGALLGDRIRLNAFYNHPNVYIRSVASRGSLGGLSDKIIEIVDVVRSADFDYIFLETVGVGQSEVEVAGLADTTVVVLVPEAGDEIQTMKAGLMEIADIFVVNKSDRAEADRFVLNLKKLIHDRPMSSWHTPVLKTVATKMEGLDALLTQINNHHLTQVEKAKKPFLLTQKAFKLIQKRRMADVDKQGLLQAIQEQYLQEDFNLYLLVEDFLGD